MIDDVAYWDGIVEHAAAVRDRPSPRTTCWFSGRPVQRRGGCAHLADVTHRRRTSASAAPRCLVAAPRQPAPPRRGRAELPAEQRRSPAAQALLDEVRARRATLVRLVRRGADQGAAATDVGFGQAMLSGLWEEGRANMDRLLASDAWRRRSPPAEGLQVIEVEGESEAPR
jgi:hypothetical protein